MRILRVCLAAAALLAAAAGCGAGPKSCSTSNCTSGTQAKYQTCITLDGTTYTISHADGSNTTDCSTISASYAQCIKDATTKACQ